MKDPYALGFEIVNKKEKPDQLRGIFVPDRIPLPKTIKRKHWQWFRDREPLIYKEAKNTVERRHRLTWLSEGSLHHHISKFKSPIPPGGCPDEKMLYAKFLVANGYYPALKS